ncbi:hypothetical protein ACHMXB_05895 [Arthrobacter sp. UC242_113]|uniref:hypothetical protein n=1 Tax=Arthrobacter sp. UC242_113 TaxID=3374550 RepID=UPI003757E055
MGSSNPTETAACLFVWIDLRTQGQGIPSVQVQIESKTLAADAGLNEERHLEASPDLKPAEVRVNIRPTDLGQFHEVTITADPLKSIEEADENNNFVTVKLSLPAIDTLPASAVCPPETTDGKDGSTSPAAEEEQVPEGGSDGSSSPAPSTETAAAGE